MNSTGAWHGEFHNRKKDGADFYTTAHLSTLQINGKKLYISVQEDVTERKQAAEALEESEARYRSLFQNNHAIMTLALELAPRKITVNAVCPGWVDTDMGRSAIILMGKTMGKNAEEAVQFAAKMAPLGEVLSPPEIAGLVAYLASPEAKNVTGQALVIDGGQVMP